MVWLFFRRLLILCGIKAEYFDYLCLRLRNYYLLELSMPWLNRTLAFSILLLRFIVQSVYLNVEAFAYYLPLIWSRASGLVHASFNRASSAHAFFALTYKLSRRSCSDVTVLCRSLSSMGTGHTTRHVWYKPCTNLCIVLGNSVTSVHRTLKNDDHYFVCWPQIGNFILVENVTYLTLLDQENLLRSKDKVKFSYEFKDVSAAFLFFYLGYS